MTHASLLLNLPALFPGRSFPPFLIYLLLLLQQIFNDPNPNPSFFSNMFYRSSSEKVVAWLISLSKNRPLSVYSLNCHDLGEATSFWVDVEGTILSPEILFQRVYNLGKKAVINSFPLTGNAQYIFGQCESYVSDYVQCPGNQGRRYSWWCLSEPQLLMLLNQEGRCGEDKSR